MAEEIIRSGRRFLFTKPEDLATKIENYFALQDPHTEDQLVELGKDNHGNGIFEARKKLTKQKPYTISGLARYLGVSRNTLRNYKDPAHYSDELDDVVRQELISTIEDAYQRVEEHNESKLHVSGLANGIKFNLVNNFDWVDKQVVEQTTPEEDLDALDDDKTTERKDLADEAAKELGEQDTAMPAAEDNSVEPPSEPRPAPQE